MAAKKPALFLSEPEGFPPAAHKILSPYVVFRKGTGGRRAFEAAASSSEIVWVRLKYFIGANVLRIGGRCRVLVTPTTGLTHVDLAVARQVGVQVLSLKGETAFLNSITATAEHTTALMLAAVRRLVPAVESVRAGRWNRNEFLGRETSKLTLGVLGGGRIGRQMARIGSVLFGRILVYDRHPRPLAASHRTSLQRLLKESDVLTIHIDESEKNRHFVDRDKIASMKRGAILVNTSRGSVLDEGALLDALKSGRLAGAALDVLAGEHAATFRPAGHPLVAYARRHSNLLITPHIGGATRDSLAAVEIFMAEKLRKRLRERPRRS